eukprot:6881487-Pyramimonas_sp.AAC.1
MKKLTDGRAWKRNPLERLEVPMAARSQSPQRGRSLNRQQRLRGSSLRGSTSAATTYDRWSIGTGRGWASSWWTSRTARATTTRGT